MSAYLRATSLDEALQVLAGRTVTVLAGGTDVYPAMAGRAAWGDRTRPDVLDIGGLSELRGIRRDGDGVVLGAATTWSDVIRADLSRAFDGLKAAAREIGGHQIQNRGTIAGNLCTASPAGDGIPALVSLDAEVELASLAGRRRVPVASFNTGYRTTALAPDELVVAVHLPPPLAGERGHFCKLGARRYLVISIAMVAATMALDPSGRIVRARIAVGACAPAAVRLSALESRLVGMPAGAAGTAARPADLDLLAPIDDIRASAAYRRSAALSLVRDSLDGLARRFEEEAA